MNYLSIISIIISVVALFLSYLSFKRTGRINKPKFINIFSNSANTFSLLIDDYSTGKNLRIDSVQVKTLKFFSRYVPMNYNTELNTINKPQRMIITISDLAVLDSYKFKITTNHGTLTHIQRGIYNSSKLRANLKQ